MLDYQTTMSIGADRYSDVLGQLASSGLPASFTQTGGMCEAIEVRLDGGSTLLITDAEDSLSWDRDQHRGWGVGLYPPASAYDAGPSVFDSTDDGGVPAVLDLVRSVLDTAVRSSAASTGHAG